MARPINCIRAIGMALALWVGGASAWAEQPVGLQAVEGDRWQLISSVIGEVTAMGFTDDAPTDWSQNAEVFWRLAPGYTEVAWQVDAPSRITGPIRWSMWIEIDGQRQTRSFVFEPGVMVVGPIPPGTTLWRVANQWQSQLGGQAPSVQTLIDLLFASNPQAFERPDASALQQGAMLRLPALQATILPELNEKTAGPAPWEAIGTRPWLESTMVQAIVQGQQQRQRRAIEAMRESARSFADGQAEIPRSFTHGLDPSVAGPWLLLLLGVVVVLLVLHGYGRIGQGLHRYTSTTDRSESQPGLSPEAVQVTLSLAQTYLSMGDAAQALHWLEEVIEQGGSKEVREAKRLWAQAQKVIDEGVS